METYTSLPRSCRWGREKNPSLLFLFHCSINKYIFPMIALFHSLSALKSSQVKFLYSPHKYKIPARRCSTPCRSIFLFARPRLVGSRRSLSFLNILFSRNRQIPGLATGAVGHSLFYSPVVSGFSPPRGRFVDPYQDFGRFEHPTTLDRALCSVRFF